MGSRGAFVDVNMNDFTFKAGGQLYQSIGLSGDVKVLVQTKGAVKAPEYSHTANRVYAIIQDGKLKHGCLLRRKPQTVYRYRFAT